MSGDSKVSCPRQRQLLDYLYLVTRQAFGALRSHDEFGHVVLSSKLGQKTRYEGAPMTHAFTATPNAIAVTHHAINHQRYRVYCAGPCLDRQTDTRLRLGPCTLGAFSKEAKRFWGLIMRLDDGATCTKHGVKATQSVPLKKFFRDRNLFGATSIGTWQFIVVQ